MDLPHKLMEAPYLAVLFCALITASTLLSLAMVSESAGPFALLASGLLSALAIAGYVISRSAGLPLIEDHIGDWLAPARRRLAGLRGRAGRPGAARGSVGAFQKIR